MHKLAEISQKDLDQLNHLEGTQSFVAACSLCNVLQVLSFSDLSFVVLWDLVIQVFVVGFHVYFNK